MITETPTGRTRHRLEKPWFGSPLLVLQVEVHQRNTYPDESRGGLYWRDAQVQDLAFIHLMSEKRQ